MSKSSSLWMTMTKMTNEKEWVLSIPVEDNDLLWFNVKSDKNGQTEIYFRYRNHDGKNFAFKKENLCFYEHDEIISLKISADTNILNILKKIKPKDIRSLRSIEIYENTPDSYLPYLEKISKIKPDIDIIMRDMKDVQKSVDIVSLFNPGLLVINAESLKKCDTSILNNLDSLFLSSMDNELDFLSDIPALRNLTLIDFKTNYTIPGINSLKSLGIHNSRIKGLSSIENLSNIKSLQILDGKRLNDISALQQFKELKTLCLTGCNKISNIQIINKIPGLRWLSLPENITQEEFVSIINAHPDLQILELIKCTNINDLGPIKNLERLIGLTLHRTSTDYNALYGLKKLQYLSISEDIYRESKEKISRLRKALPDCDIVPGDPLCLGSGWILLIFPIVLLFRLMKKK